jgi:ABC-type protease/lipase transport system fused ATPase/permease subunit
MIKKARAEDRKRKNRLRTYLPSDRFSFSGFRGTLWSLLFFSFVGGGISALSAIFIIQIYDRIIPSHSISTLIVLVVVFLIFYLAHGVLTLISNRLCERLGLAMLNRYEPLFLNSIFSQSRDKKSHDSPYDHFLEVINAIRTQILIAWFDLIWVPILLFILFLSSPYMALLAVTLIGIQFSISYFLAPDYQSSQDAEAKRLLSGRGREQAAAAPISRIVRLTAQARQDERVAQLSAKDRERDLRSIGVSFREISHSGMLALGAFLVISDTMTIGMMMAIGMLMMRINSPIQVVLRQLDGARLAWSAYQKLKSYDLAPLRQKLEQVHSHERKPVTDLVVSRLSLAPPRSEDRQGFARFSLRSGQCMSITGMSGSGKSLLLKRLCGIVGSKPDAILLGDRPLASIGDEQLASLIGYMPQENIFLSATILETITRFDPSGNRDRVIELCKQINVHHHIIRLENGYDTMIAPDAAKLPSALLRLVAFARAIYNHPPLLLLDDPFRSLPSEAVWRLADMIGQLKSAGSIVIMATPELFTTDLVDYALILHDHAQPTYGSLAEVLSKTTGRIQMVDALAPKRGHQTP